MGAGTTARVAKQEGRNYIGFELNPKYIEMAEKRIAESPGPVKPEPMLFEVEEL
jgi:DNA modification methylase